MKKKMEFKKFYSVRHLPEFGVVAFMVNENDKVLYHIRELDIKQIYKGIRELESEKDLDCPYNFTSRCTLGRCDCKPKELDNEF